MLEKFEVTITANFEAAHRIPGYPGKCSQLHGHNWTIEVGVSGEQLNHLGMVMDFRELKAEVGKAVNTLDHCFLNELTAFCQYPPTAETIAKYLFDSLLEPLSGKNVTLLYVRVWESPSASVIYRRG